jgi:hypothetical protein
VAFRILREPAAEYPFLLHEHFADAPEAAEGEASDYDGKNIVIDDKGNGGEDQTSDQPDPPALLSEVKFHLDDKWVTDAYAEEYSRSNDDAVVIH